MVDCHIVIETHLFFIKVLNCFAKHVDGSGHVVDYCIFFGDNGPIFIDAPFPVEDRKMINNILKSLEHNSWCDSCAG